MTAPKKIFKYCHIRMLVSFKVHDKSTYEKGKKTIEISKKSIHGEISSELKISTSHILTQMKFMGLETKNLLAFTITLKMLFKDTF